MPISTKPPSSVRLAILIWTPRAVDFSKGEVTVLSAKHKDLWGRRPNQARDPSIMALKWRGYPGSNPVRLALPASRDKINRTPGDVCYDLLWYSCHSHIALPDKIMITLGTLDPFSNSHDSVRPTISYKIVEPPPDFQFICPCFPPSPLVNVAVPQKSCRITRVISIRYFFQNNIDMGEGGTKISFFSRVAQQFCNWLSENVAPFNGCKSKTFASNNVKLIVFAIHW